MHMSNNQKKGDVVNRNDKINKERLPSISITNVKVQKRNLALELDDDIQTTYRA